MYSIIKYITTTHQKWWIPRFQVVSSYSNPPITWRLPPWSASRLHLGREMHQLSCAAPASGRSWLVVSYVCGSSRGGVAVSLRCRLNVWWGLHRSPVEKVLWDGWGVCVCVCVCVIRTEGVVCAALWACNNWEGRCTNETHTDTTTRYTVKHTHYHLHLTHLHHLS